MDLSWCLWSCLLRRALLGALRKGVASAQRSSFSSPEGVGESKEGASKGGRGGFCCLVQTRLAKATGKRRVLRGIVRRTHSLQAPLWRVLSGFRVCGRRACFWSWLLWTGEGCGDSRQKAGAEREQKRAREMGAPKKKKVGLVCAWHKEASLEMLSLAD